MLSSGVIFKKSYIRKFIGAQHLDHHLEDVSSNFKSDGFLAQ